MGEQGQPQRQQGGTMDEAEWAITACGGALLGDRRRTDRLSAVAPVRGQRPNASLPAAWDDAALRTGADRLCANRRIMPAAILASQSQAPRERGQRRPGVLALQDTTERAVTGHRATKRGGSVTLGTRAGAGGAQSSRGAPWGTAPRRARSGGVGAPRTRHDDSEAPLGRAREPR